VIRAFRIVQAKFASRAFDGEGASLYPGRWNQAGILMIYTAESLALATLEIFVQLNKMSSIELDYVYFDLSIPPEITVESLQHLPEHWNQYPPINKTQELGANWIRTEKTAVLKVPSTIIPTEFNYLLNPKHADFKKIKIGKPKHYIFDERLWAKN